MTVIRAAFAVAFILSAVGAQAPGYARLEADSTLRCFATEHSPVFSESLRQGSVVRVDPDAEARNGFRAVQLPLGVLGYVHSNHAELGDDGVVRSTGSRVSFRYRPQGREAPVAYVDAGTEFRYVGQEGDWFQVRYDGVQPWVSTEALLVFDGEAEVDTLEKAWEDLRSRQVEAAEAAVSAREAKRAAEAALTERKQKLGAVGEAFAAEQREPIGEQDYAEIRTQLEAIRSELEDGSELAGQAQALDASLVQAEKKVAAFKLLADEGEPGPVPETPVETREDPFAGFVTGWVRFERPLFGQPRLTLEKGGQVMFELQCANGRYDLAVFDGLEVALKGQSQRLDAESLRVLDVQKLEVLALPRGRR